MSGQLDSAQLRGLAYDWAHLFGMPHIGAEYRSYRTGTYRVFEGEPCLICGRQATNAHHVVPRSVWGVFHIDGHELRSPLFALCGSGTQGCHDGFHGGARYEVVWEWDSDEEESLWWDGTMLGEMGYMPHDDRLFRHGKYVIHDKKLDLDIVLRG